MKLIMENWRKFVLKENAEEWFNSPDNDWPRKEEVISLKKGDKYEERGSTHGLTSHSIKHLTEFSKDFVFNLARAAIKYIKERRLPVYRSEADGTNPASTRTTKEVDVNQIKVGQVLNMFDLINDKTFHGPHLNDHEGYIFENFIEPMNRVYHDQILLRIVSNARDISDSEVQTYQNLVNLLETGRPVIELKATFKGTVRTYYVDTKNSTLVSKREDGKYATLFKASKKDDESVTLQQAVKQFGSGKRSPATDEYSLFRQYVDKLNSSVVHQQPKKRKKRQDNQDLSNPMGFAADRLRRNVPEEKVVQIIMNVHKKSEPDARNIVAAAQKAIQTQEGQKL